MNTFEYQNITDNYDLRANLKLLKVLDLLFSLKYFYFSFKVFTSTFRFIYYNKNIYIGISKTKVIAPFLYSPIYRVNCISIIGACGITLSLQDFIRSSCITNHI
ncbi:hypothetical protein RSJ2_872 [Clostridium botulinum]|nr:hypothetical protein RSJ2_872 [Clostridium botulinum]APU59726.1 hypothetical protein NPD8_1685 [Clostridium botulinum]OSA82960.1 hypothetical protein B2H84_03950 [Clostridium botulinum]BDB00754.1 hypothetical protein CBOS2020_08280 [Clostridium botulinum]